MPRIVNGAVPTEVALMLPDDLFAAMPNSPAAFTRAIDPPPAPTVRTSTMAASASSCIKAKACGGDALMRRAALDAVGGYREDLIAGEEPEMCFRMRAHGWRIVRLDAEMTRHDADMTRLSQWWQRSRRAGHTYAEGAALHGRSPERYRMRELRRTLVWGLALPLAALLGALLLTPWALLGLLVYPGQIARMVLRGMDVPRAAFLVLGKFPELQGVLGYWVGRLSGRRRRLIEYK